MRLCYLLLLLLLLLLLSRNEVIQLKLKDHQSTKTKCLPKVPQSTQWNLQNSQMGYLISHPITSSRDKNTIKTVNPRSIKENIS